MAFRQKTRHFGKIMAFTAFDKNHGIRDFRVSMIIYCPYRLSPSQAVLARPTGLLHSAGGLSAAALYVDGPPREQYKQDLSAVVTLPSPTLVRGGQFIPNDRSGCAAAAVFYCVTGRSNDTGAHTASDDQV